MSADRSIIHRIVSVAFGIFFIGIAVAIVAMVHPHGIGSIAVALVLAALGVDELISATRNRTSLLMRIGPLP